MSDYNIGPGVQAAMDQAGDEARSDEQFVILREGNKVSMTFGRDAVYYYYEADNRTQRCPFEVAQEETPGQPWDPWTAQPGQVYDWTCSACATEWTERAVWEARGDDVYTNREQVVYAIGYPNNISSSVGLHDGSGAQLQRVLSEHAGLNTQQGWLNFDQAVSIYSNTLGLGSGGAYYHWVAFRGVSGSNLWISNSAPGYRGIWDELSRYDYDRLGPWSCIWVS
jgi:hypothetical protein